MGCRMADLMVTRGNLDEAMTAIEDEIARSHVAMVAIKSGNTGKWGMARLWRSWMEATAKFMAANGVTMPLMISADGRQFGSRPFSAQDAHELFTHQHLGCDSDGTRLSWSKAGHDGMRPATRGERFDALRRHEAWATERGIRLFNPRDSEYRELMKEQEQ